MGETYTKYKARISRGKPKRGMENWERGPRLVFSTIDLENKEDQSLSEMEFDNWLTQP